jgi:hypothetical protein
MAGICHAVLSPQCVLKITYHILLHSVNCSKKYKLLLRFFYSIIVYILYFKSLTVCWAPGEIERDAYR